MAKTKGTTYKQAGVDIDAGDALIERIKPFAKATNRAGVMGGLGGFGALFDLQKAGKYKHPILVSSTDGVGTKLKIAQEMGKHDTIGQDLVAMCVNDLIVQGAEPLFFLDYFATGKLEIGVAEQVIKGIADGCKLAGCALVGGETAEMPGMYASGDYDLAGFSVGVVEKEKILPSKNIEKGDVVLGLASSGLHSNGFSLVRHVMKKNKLDYHSPAPFDKKKILGEILLTPTKIYVRSCLALLHKFPNDIKALAHITGGGLRDNFHRVIPDDMALETTKKPWALPDIFVWLEEAGKIPKEDLNRTFNCGVGMVLVVSKKVETEVKAFLEKEGENVYRIGAMIKQPMKKVVVHD